MAVQRIEPEQARREISSGGALLVCAYDDDEKCKHYELSGALTLSELQRREHSLARDQEIIFYCA